MAVKIDQKIVNASVVDESKKTPQEPTKEVDVTPPQKQKRPDLLSGSTAKIKVGGKEPFNCYLTLNCLEGNVPFEVFIDSSHTDNVHYVKALSRLISAMLRSNDPQLNLQFIGNELAKIHANDGYFAKIAGKKKGNYQNGIVQHIGRTLISLHNKVENHKTTSTESVELPKTELPISEQPIKDEWNTGIECPECKRPTLAKIDGCMKCMDIENCGHLGECG